jgi:carboxypeptidase family protein
MQRVACSRKIAGLNTARRIAPTGTRVLWANLCLETAFALCGPTVAKAGIVSGRVYGVDQNPVANANLKAARAAGGQPVEFKSDASGNFSVYLDPGRFTVRLRVASELLEGRIDSYPQPVQQDIYLKRPTR